MYRREVAKRSVRPDDIDDAPRMRRDMYDGLASFAARYAAERLAVVDGDVDRLVELLGGDLSSLHHFTRVAESMVRADDALMWARRGHR